MAVGDSGEIVAAGTEDCVDLVVVRQKPLNLTRRFRLPHDFPPFSAQAMRTFNSVVQALMSTMIGIRRDRLYLLDIAAQLVRHDDTELTELPDQS